MPHPSSQHWILVLIGSLTLAAPGTADNRVAVVAWADEAYTQRKFQHQPPRVETYVFMQGRLFKSPTRDDSLNNLAFRQIAEALAVEIARENYLPTTDTKEADLLLVVHWGSTTPRVTSDELRGVVDTGITTHSEPGPQEYVEPRPEDDAASSFFADWGENYREWAFDTAVRVTDGLDADLKAASNASLLGYSSQLWRLSKSPIPTPMEQTMKSDLHSERYFIIVKAYDLKAPRIPGIPRRPVWTLHLNMRSPGQNFRTALSRMSNVAVAFAGRNVPDMQTVRPKERTGVVTLGPLKVIGYVD